MIDDIIFGFGLGFATCGIFVVVLFRWDMITDFAISRWLSEVVYMKTLKQRILDEMSTNLKRDEIKEVNEIWHEIITHKTDLRPPFWNMEEKALRSYVENRYLQLKKKED